jgi:hypothetical protein
MKTPFNKLSDNARVWIYPASRKLSNAEVVEIKKLCDDFTNQWTAHDSSLLASVDIPYNRFIVILDKMNVTFKQGEYLTYKSLNDFKDMVKKGSINANTVVFNNLVNDLAGYKSEWEIPMKHSWHSRFIK